MAWIRLLEDGAPEGEEVAEEIEVLSLPDVGDCVAIHELWPELGDASGQAAR